MPSKKEVSEYVDMTYQTYVSKYSQIEQIRSMSSTYFNKGGD